mmetsp:Transcript_70762/g.224008  ORF Transcript_70762/g.224008 Transcript_70762/m.224008 type:complete len:202 (+) Transcript_70762:42-647(+)
MASAPSLPLEAREGVQLREVQEALARGGYYRALMPELDPLDTIAGGLAFYITACSMDHAMDVEYPEDPNLGQKIAVCEALEDALLRMGCPCPIQAHQVQGLNFDVLTPVVAWLVGRAEADREEFGKSRSKFAQSHYASQWQYNMQASQYKPAGQWGESVTLGLGFRVKWRVVLRIAYALIQMRALVPLLAVEVSWFKVNRI